MSYIGNVLFLCFFCNFSRCIAVVMGKVARNNNGNNTHDCCFKVVYCFRFRFNYYIYEKKAMEETIKEIKKLIYKQEAKGVIITDIKLDVKRSSAIETIIIENIKI